MGSQYGYLHMKRIVHAYLGLLIESYSLPVLKILVPRNDQGQRSYRQGINLQNLQTAHAALCQKNKPNQKMGRRSK